MWNDLEKRQRFLEIASLVLAIAAYCFLCIWYVGVIFMILSVVAAVLYLKQDKISRMLKVVLILDGIFIGFLLLLLIFSAMYMGVIDSIYDIKS